MLALRRRSGFWRTIGGRKTTRRRRLRSWHLLGDLPEIDACDHRSGRHKNCGRHIVHMIMRQAMIRVAVMIRFTVMIVYGNRSSRHGPRFVLNLQRVLDAIEQDQ